MPTYDYHCTACHYALEIFQRMSDPHLTDCPACAQPALKRKIGTGAGLIFKGGGFYETDFKDRKGTQSDESAANAEKPAGDKSASTATPATADSTAAKNGTSKDAAASKADTTAAVPKENAKAAT